MKLQNKTVIVIGASDGIFSPARKKSGCMKSELNIKLINTSIVYLTFIQMLYKIGLLNPPVRA